MHGEHTETTKLKDDIFKLCRTCNAHIFIPNIFIMKLENLKNYFSDYFLP